VTLNKNNISNDHRNKIGLGPLKILYGFLVNFGS